MPAEPLNLRTIASRARSRDPRAPRPRDGTQFVLLRGGSRPGAPRFGGTHDPAARRGRRIGGPRCVRQVRRSGGQLHRLHFFRSHAPASIKPRLYLRSPLPCRGLRGSSPALTHRHPEASKRIVIGGRERLQKEKGRPETACGSAASGLGLGLSGSSSSSLPWPPVSSLRASSRRPASGSRRPGLPRPTPSGDSSSSG
jgi:hypothetical protein